MRSFAAVLALSLLLIAPVERVSAQDPAPAAPAEPWSAEELENLLAPIALYPDPILAQVLIAATFPEQITLAAAYVRANGTVGIDDQPWEISVKAVAHYPPVLNLMAEGEDWTTALGQAYAAQSGDVMAAVQNLRRMANAQGNLETTAQQRVVVEQEMIKIIPAEPKVIYVPTYDPAVVYFRPIYVAHAHPAYWSWGVGYPIGVWLTYDFDWYSHRIYYHGWHGPSWVFVSRPWIVMSPIYYSPRHTVIVVNRRIGHRHIDYYHLRRYTWVHRDQDFGRRGEWDRRRHEERGERGDDQRYDRRDGWRDGPAGDRGDRASGGRRTTPVPSTGVPARRELVQTPAWSPRARSATTTTAPRTTPRDETTTAPRNSNRSTPRVTPRTTPRTQPGTTPRGSTPTTATPERQRIVSAPSWSSGRTLGSASASRTRTPTETRRQTTAPRTSTGSRGAATPQSSGTTRRPIVAQRGVTASRSAAASPRSSSGSRSSGAAAPRSSSGSRSGAAAPRSSSGSRSSSSTPRGSSGSRGGERRRN